MKDYWASKIRVLYIEDSKIYYNPLVYEFKKIPYVNVNHIKSLEEFKELKKKKFDIVLTDLNFLLLKDKPKGRKLSWPFGQFIGIYYKFIYPELSNYVVCYSNDYNNINKTFFHKIYNKKELNFNDFVNKLLENYDKYISNQKSYDIFDKYRSSFDDDSEDDGNVYATV